ERALLGPVQVEPRYVTPEPLAVWARVKEPVHGGLAGQHGASLRVETLLEQVAGTLFASYLEVRVAAREVGHRQVALNNGLRANQLMPQQVGSRRGLGQH